MTEILNRMQEPTPRFFVRLRNMGLMLAAASAAILAAPVTLPSIVITLAGYLAVAGSVASAVSQTAIPVDDPDFK